MVTNSDEYLDTISKVIDSVENMKEERQDVRYSELYGEKY